MIIASLIVFGIAALFGMILIGKVATEQPTPKLIVVLHGLFAATGLGLLAADVMSNPASKVAIPLVIFLIVALVGFYMLSRDLMKKLIPKGLAVVHAIVAVCSYVFLLYLAMSA